jgi:hypothetical protein
METHLELSNGSVLILKHETIEQALKRKGVRK